MQHAKTLSYFTDAVFVLLTLYLVLNYLRSIFAAPEPLILVMQQALFTAYLLIALILMAIRHGATEFSSRIRDYVYTLLGLGSPLLFQPAPRYRGEPVGVTLAFLGTILVLGAFLSLNRSFGLAPQNRGIKSTGLYRLVRHPMYLGYILAETGFVVDNLSIFNLFALAVSFLFLLLRLRAEERLLETDPIYRAYTKKIRWKLIPFLF